MKELRSYALSFTWHLPSCYTRYVTMQFVRKLTCYHSTVSLRGPPFLQDVLIACYAEALSLGSVPLLV